MSVCLALLMTNCFYRNQLKRKEHPDEAEAKAAAVLQGHPIPSGSNARPDEYESGCVVCGACGATVSIRDEETNKFTVKQWDAHRLVWYVLPHITSGFGLPRVSYAYAHVVGHLNTAHPQPIRQVRQ